MSIGGLLRAAAIGTFYRHTRSSEGTTGAVSVRAGARSITSAGASTSRRTMTRNCWRWWSR